MTRRTLLGLMTAGVAAGAGLFYVSRDRDDLEAWEREVVAGLRRDLPLQAPEVLGQAAVEVVGEERPGALARRLFRRPHRFRGQDAASALEAVRAQIRSDYAAGRTLSVEGWELSETEVLLFAVLHVSDRPSGGGRSTARRAAPGTRVRPPAPS